MASNRRPTATGLLLDEALLDDRGLNGRRGGAAPTLLDGRELDPDTLAVGRWLSSGPGD